MTLWPCPVTGFVSNLTGTEVYTEHAHTRSPFVFFLESYRSWWRTLFYCLFKTTLRKGNNDKTMYPGRRELQTWLYSTALRFTFTICTFTNKTIRFFSFHWGPVCIFVLQWFYSFLSCGAWNSQTLSCWLLHLYRFWIITDGDDAAIWTQGKQRTMAVLHLGWP